MNIEEFQPGDILILKDEYKGQFKIYSSNLIIIFQNFKQTSTDRFTSKLILSTNLYTHYNWPIKYFKKATKLEIIDLLNEFNQLISSKKITKKELINLN